MAKIVMPAFSQATHFFTTNWRGIILLALKTYVTIFLIQALLSIFGYIITEGSKAFILQTPSTAVGIPLSLKIMRMVINIVALVISQWVASPLYVSICRSAILGSPFDRYLFRHLTDRRTLHVTKLLCLLILLIIPFYIFGFAFTLIKTLISEVALILANLIYFFISIYLSMRIYYLIPALACDRYFSSLSELWSLSKGKAWSVFKVFLLIFLIAIGVVILLGIVFVLLAVLMGMVATLTGGIKLVSGILIVALMVLAAIIGLVILLLVIPQLVTATVAKVYQLSEDRTKKA